jgi:hypothetical protein
MVGPPYDEFALRTHESIIEGSGFHFTGTPVSVSPESRFPKSGLFTDINCKTYYNRDYYT